MNRNMERYLVRHAFENDAAWSCGAPNNFKVPVEIEIDDGDVYEIKITERDTYNEIYIFAPEHATEKWSIVVNNGGMGGISNDLEAQILWLCDMIAGVIHNNWRK